MRKHAVWMTTAVLLLASCTDADEPDVTTDTPTGAVDTATGTETGTDTGTGDPTVTDTGAPTATATDTATATGTAAGSPGEPTTDVAVRTECETAVAEAGGLEDLRNVDRLRPVFEACNSIEDFTAAVESQLEGFEDVDLQPYVRTGCNLARDLAGTPLCESM